jgi:hypothetical protein
VARRILALVAVGALLVAACSPQAGTLDTGARQDELAPALLTEEEVRSAPQAPPDLEAVPPDRANLSEDTDPRGPCGAEVEALPILDGAVAVFGRDDVVVVHIVLADTGGLAERLVDATIADLAPGCAAFTKETPFENPQTTELIGEIALGDAGDESVAFQSIGVVGDAEAVYGVQSMVRIGDALSTIVMLSATRLPDEFVAALSRSAAERLAALPAG